MATKKLTKQDIDKITLLMSKSLLDAEGFFASVATKFDQNTQARFREQGAGGGPRKIPTDQAWPAFSGKTLMSKSGLFRVRTGTDGKKSRYSFASKMLQASGDFRKSFRNLKVDKKGASYGTNHRLAGKIGAWPLRQVLVQTDEDDKIMSRMFAKWYADDLRKRL